MRGGTGFSLLAQLKYYEMACCRLTDVGRVRPRTHALPHTGSREIPNTKCEGAVRSVRYPAPARRHESEVRRRSSPMTTSDLRLSPNAHDGAVQPLVALLASPAVWSCGSAGEPFAACNGVHSRVVRGCKLFACRGSLLVCCDVRAAPFHRSRIGGDSQPWSTASVAAPR